MDLTLCIILLVAGFVLLAVEPLLPTGGVLFVAGLLAIGGGIFVAFQLGAYVGGMVLLASFGGLVVACVVIGYVWPRTPLGRRFIVQAPQEDTTLSALPGNQDLERLKGRIGRTLSALRPAGVVDFDGRRVDTITEGMMVEPGQYVRCIDVRAGKVLVRPIDQPDLGDMEGVEFFDPVR